MELVLGIIAGLLILTFLVVIHELGHAIVARRNGVTVQEFGIGFPPRAKAWKKKKSFLGKDVEYSLNWLPIGGFVKLQGEHDEDGGKGGDFGRASFWAKTKILLAGVAVNWLAAAIIFTILALVGVPKILANQFYIESDATITRTSYTTISQVEPGLPAAEAGLQSGDQIDRIVATDVCETWPGKIDASCPRLEAETVVDIVDITRNYPGATFEVNYIRDGEERQTELVNRTAEEVEQDSENRGYIGVGFSQNAQSVVQSTWSAPFVGVGLTAQLSWETLKGIGGLASNFFGGLAQKLSPDEATRQEADQRIAEAGDTVAGPVGLIGNILPSLISEGIVYTLLIMAIISLSLAVLNSLPIPGLDGGRWALIAVYRAMNRPLTKEREEQIVGYGMLFLLSLFVLITISDVGKFF